jgi:hypothetical protein
VKRFGCGKALLLVTFLCTSKEQVTRSEGAKALAVAVAVAFNKQQIKRKSSGASSALISCRSGTLGAESPARATVPL